MVNLKETWESLGWIKYLILTVVIVIIVGIIVLVVVLVKKSKTQQSQTFIRTFGESFEASDVPANNWEDSKANINDFVNQWKNVVKNAYTKSQVQLEQQLAKTKSAQTQPSQTQQFNPKSFAQSAIKSAKSAVNQQLKQAKSDLNQQLDKLQQQTLSSQQTLQPKDKETYVSSRYNYGNAERKYRLAAGQNVTTPHPYLEKEQVKEEFVAPRQTYGNAERKYRQAQVYTKANQQRFEKKFGEGYQQVRGKKDFSKQTALQGMSVKTGVNYRY